MSAPEPVRPVIGLLLVDDHAVVRRGVQAYLESFPDLVVLGEATDGQHALEVLERWQTLGEALPDVVLMDLRMPRLDGVSATRSLSSRFPLIRVVILTSFGEVERVHAALAEGAAGYVLKDAEPAELAAAIRAAAAGEVHLDAAVAGQLARRMTAPRTGVSALTTREREILVLVAQGHSNQEIADRLVISERTARTHVSSVLAKLQLTSRTQAALLAVREGLISPA